MSMHDAGIVDENVHDAESLFSGVESLPHGGAVAHVGLHCQCAPARLFY